MLQRVGVLHRTRHGGSGDHFDDFSDFDDFDDFSNFDDFDDYSDTNDYSDYNGGQGGDFGNFYDDLKYDILNFKGEDKQDVLWEGVHQIETTLLYR